MTSSREETGDRGVGDALRDAVERTLAATAGSAVTARDRAGELVDELARRGQVAGAELAKRGQDAGAELAKRGQDAGAELGRRLELLERRLAEVEDGLRRQAEEAAAETQDGGEGPTVTKPKAEG